MREACRQTKIWLDAGILLPLIAVNVSGLQLKTALELETAIAAIFVVVVITGDFIFRIYSQAGI